MVSFGRRLTGKELHILRMEYNINPNYLVKKLNITPRQLMNYEFIEKEIPDCIYNAWIEIIIPYLT